MAECPKCGLEYKTESRMKNHIPKCHGNCSYCNKPLGRLKTFCSKHCFNSYMKYNIEYATKMTMAANKKTRELGKKGQHWTQQKNDKTIEHHKKWHSAGQDKIKYLIKNKQFWSQLDKEKVKKAMKKIHTEENHKKLSQSLTGRKFSQEHKDALSKVRIQKGLAKGKNNPMYGKHPVTTKGFKAGMRVDLGHFVRSSWEANFARILKYNNIKYEFESERFEIIDENQNELTYTPDFKVGDKYYEIKGFWYDDARHKFILFCQQYPEIQIEIIDSVKYQELKIQYKSKIKEWEK